MSCQDYIWLQYSKISDDSSVRHNNGTIEVYVELVSQKTGQGGDVP